MKDYQFYKDIELEKNILGAILIDSSVYEDICDLIKPEMFFDSHNREIFEAMRKLDEKNIPIDTVTIFQQLRESESTVKPDYLGSLSLNVYTSVKIQAHAEILKQYYLRRQIVKVAEEVIKKNHKGTDVADIVNESIEQFERISNQDEQIESEYNFCESFENVFQEIIKEQETGASSGWKTKNFPSLNKCLEGGFQLGEMTVFSGIDKSGKTTLGTGITIDLVVNSNVRAAIFSLEMPFSQLSRKIISIATGTRYGYLRAPSTKNKYGQFVFGIDKIQECAAKVIRMFSNKNLFIVDSVTDDIGIKNTIKYLHRKYGIQLFMIDYIGLIETRTKKERRDLEIAQISRMFKQLAMELKITFIILSQENDEGSTAESKALRRDCDFWFSISHPVDLGREQIKYEGQSYPIDQGHHLITYKRSRHSPNGGIFFAYYFKNGEFKEIDLQHSEKLNL